MKNSKRIFAILLTLCLIVTSIAVLGVPASAADAKAFSNNNELLMWYNTPARSTPRTGSEGSTNDGTGEHNIWQQTTLPIGNGFMGASIYGEISREEIVLNEESLWTGGPSNSRKDYNGGNLNKVSTWKQIVEYFKAGNNTAASNLCAQLVGVSGSANGSGGYGSYQPFGKLYIDFGISASSVQNYVRTLDLTNAISTVEYDYNGVHYKREYFMSYPDNVMTVKITADADNAITCTTTLQSSQGATASASGDTVTIKGALSDNQLKYNGKVKVVATGGTQSASGTGITVTGANEVTMYLALATDYENTYPKYRTGETDAQVDAKVSKRVEDAAKKGYDKVLADHLADYTKLFDRVDLDLGQVPSDIPTNELLNRYKGGTATTAQRRGLEVILFQYGRYLTIASSREGSLPSNLQGVWNINTNPPWSSDYHMNVNLQMNYWPTYSTNLAECAIPLIDYVDSLREPGRVTAANYFGIVSENGEENGFTAHTQNTIFGWTCPGWSFSWGWSPAAVPWILQNCYEYYEYTGDVDYLRSDIYPMLLEESKLYNQILVQIGDRYVTAPSYSPEHGPYTAGNTYESTLVWQLFNDTLYAAEVLGDKENTQLLSEIKEKMGKLDPIEIGTDGQIKEWFGDQEGKIGKTASGSAIPSYDSNHRHISHMLGLFPGDLIQTKEEWIEAAKVSMNARPDRTTGWGMGQRINTWARLGDGDRALSLINYLFNSGIYPNLWDAHAPFQIDGNFGMTSGVAEMLLQSNMGYINILPALPSDWSSGSYSGLVARGNFEVSVDWKFGTANKIQILSNNGGACIVGYDKFDTPVVKDSKGANVSSKINSNGYLEFNTTKGETYTITGFEGVTPLAPTGVTATVYRDNKVLIEWEYESGLKYAVVRVNADGTETDLGTYVNSCIDQLAEGVDAREITYKVYTIYNGKQSDPAEAVPSPLGMSIEIDRTGMTATACSEYSQSTAEGADGPAKSVLDGNPNTHWHTNWSNDTSVAGEHHWLEINLNGTKTITSISYLPRQQGNVANGTFTKFDIIITKPDGTTETVMKDVTTDGSTSEKTFVLPHAVQATKVKFQINDAVGDNNGVHGTAAEIRFFGSKLIELGDVNADGSTDAADVTLLQKKITKYDIEDYEEYFPPYADVNGDGIVNIKDATLIQKAIVGIKDIVDDNPYLK